MKTLDEVLDRGIVSSILPSKEAFVEAANNKILSIYIGVDPTGTTLHLSHAKNYMLLEELRLLGHEVIVLFGDFTARIGDPSDKSAARVRLSSEEIKKNVTSWLEQIQPLMNFEANDNPPRVMYNADWLSKLTFEELIEIASNFTVQQMIERDMFDKRLKENKPIHLHEFFYPMMQGYDSVVMDVDVEMCGTDQTFNALAGRTLQKRFNNKEKFVMVVNLMEDPETGLMMSKSKGTGVFLDTTAEEMFRGIMAQPDSMTELLFINNTRLDLDEIKEIVSGDPLKAKERVAHEITRIFHGEPAGNAAHEAFVRKVRNKDLRADDYTDTKVESGAILSDILVSNDVVSSKSEFRRLLEAGAIRNADSGDKFTEDSAISESTKVSVGKKRHVNLIVT